MKKTILFIISLALVYGAGAQVYLLDTFYLAATQKTYGIYADIDAGNRGHLYFDMETQSGMQQVQCQLKIPTYEINSGVREELYDFLEPLKKCKGIYARWKQIAEQSSVRMFSKKMPIYFRDQLFHFSQDGKWYYENGVDISVKFYVDANGKALCIIETDYMTSQEVVAHSYSMSASFTPLSPNPAWGFTVGNSQSKVTVEKYCSGASLPFSSEDEIDMFVEKIEKIIEWKLAILQEGKKYK